MLAKHQLDEHLAYVIGVLYGDGCMYQRTGKHIITLRVFDEEFAEEFARVLSIVSNRVILVHNYKVKGGIEYRAEVGHKKLFNFLKANKSRLLTDIVNSSNNKVLARFLCGFFDSEGSITEIGQIRLPNQNLNLLELSQYMLLKLDITTGGIGVSSKKGTLCGYNKKYKMNADCFVFSVSKGCNDLFYQKIGFTISRKQKRLEQYLNTYKHIFGDINNIKRGVW